MSEKAHVFKLRAADPGPDGFDTHHVLKFHPGDRESVMKMGDEWLFRKDAPKVSAWEKKKKAEALKKKGGPAPVLEPDMSFKQPWLITEVSDESFLSCFQARRETDKRSSLDVKVHATLTQVRVSAPKQEMFPGSRVAKINEELDRLYVELKTLVSGPAAYVFNRKVNKKKRLVEPGDHPMYEVIELECRVSSSAIKLIDQRISRLEAIETSFVKDFGPQIKENKMEFNGKMLRYKVLDDGKKQHSFFWVESTGDREVFQVRPVHGDWWAARKDGMRRGMEAPAEGEEGKKAKPAPGPGFEGEARFNRLMMKTEVAKAKNVSVQEQQGQGGARKRVLQSGEDALKQKWHEESHTMDDDMDCQQCGDIDDDDYDNKMAAAGDDLAVAPDALAKELEEEVPEENLNEMSDSEGEEDDDKKDMDEDGRKMNRMLQGKPAEEAKNVQMSDDEEEEGKKPADAPQASKKSKKDTVGSVKIKIKAPEVKEEPGTKRPAASGASDTGPAAKKAKTAGAAAGAGAGTAASASAPAAAGAGAGTITAEDVRNAIRKDPEMTMKKLVAVFNANSFQGAEKAAFLAAVKEAAAGTKQTVQEGQYKGQMIVTVKGKKKT